MSGCARRGRNAAVLGSRARAKENHLASPWARLKRDVNFALRERFGATHRFQVAWLYDYDVGQGSRVRPASRAVRLLSRAPRPI